LLGSNLPLTDGQDTSFTFWERLRRWLA